MKKLLSVFAVVAMLFSFASCSGDLHDDVKIDPNAMEGYWSYAIVDASKATSGTVGVTPSVMGAQAGGFGSNFLFDIAPGDKLEVLWDGKNGSDCIASTRTDCPSLESLGITLEDGKAAIFVFSTSSWVYLHVYDSVETETLLNGSWQSEEQKTTATVAVEKWSFTVSQIELVNCPEIGGAGYIAICEGWVPGNEWNATTPNKITDAENAVLALSSPHKPEAEGEADISLALQILNPENDEGFWGNKISNGDKVTATGTKAACNGKTMKLVVTFSDATTCTAEFVEI